MIKKLPQFSPISSLNIQQKYLLKLIEKEDKFDAFSSLKKKAADEDEKILRSE